MRRLFAALMLFVCSDLYAGDCKINANAVLGILDFEIEGCVVEGKLVEGGGHLSGTFSVDLTKLDTGLDLRNKHMHEKYLESDKNPIAVMKLEPIKIGAESFKGHLSLHGKSRPVTGKVLKSSATELRASFTIKITDYGIEKPGYKGIVIGEKIDIFVSVD